MRKGSTSFGACKVRCWRWLFGNRIPVSLGIDLGGPERHLALGEDFLERPQRYHLLCDVGSEAHHDESDRDEEEGDLIRQVEERILKLLQSKSS